jgi:hypothetical protein
LSKDLTSTKLELEDSKERAINLALRLKDLEIKHVEVVWNIFYMKEFYLNFYLESRIK